MDIGRAIKHTMNENGVTDAQLARDCGLTAGYVSMLVNSKVNDMKLHRAYVIADYLGVSLEYLVELAMSYESENGQ